MLQCRCPAVGTGVGRTCGWGGTARCHGRHAPWGHQLRALGAQHGGSSQQDIQLAVGFCAHIPSSALIKCSRQVGKGQTHALCPPRLRLLVPRPQVGHPGRRGASVGAAAATRCVAPITLSASQKILQLTGFGWRRSRDPMFPGTHFHVCAREFLATNAPTAPYHRVCAFAWPAWVHAVVPCPVARQGPSGRLGNNQARQAPNPTKIRGTTTQR